MPQRGRRGESEAFKAIMAHVKKEVRERRLARGWTVPELAYHSDLAESNIFNIETGTRSGMSLESACGIAAALGSGLDHLTGFSPQTYRVRADSRMPVEAPTELEARVGRLEEGMGEVVEFARSLRPLLPQLGAKNGTAPKKSKADQSRQGRR